MRGMSSCRLFTLFMQLAGSRLKCAAMDIISSWVPGISLNPSRRQEAAFSGDSLMAITESGPREIILTVTPIAAAATPNNFNDIAPHYS